MSKGLTGKDLEHKVETSADETERWQASHRPKDESKVACATLCEVTKPMQQLCISNDSHQSEVGNDPGDNELGTESLVAERHDRVSYVYIDFELV